MVSASLSSGGGGGGGGAPPELLGPPRPSAPGELPLCDIGAGLDE